MWKHSFVFIHSGKGKGRTYHKLLRGKVAHSHNQPEGKRGPQRGESWFFPQPLLRLVQRPTAFPVVLCLMAYICMRWWSERVVAEESQFRWD